MPSLLGPDGNPIQEYTKGTPPKMGPSYGAWAGRDTFWNELPGGAILQFDLSQLTLADYRAMRYNPQINSSLSVLGFMLHQMDWHIECKDKKIAAKIDEIFRPAWTQLMRATNQSHWAGYAPTVMEFDNDMINESVIISKFKDLVPETCKVHWKYVDGAIPPGMNSTVPPKIPLYDGIDQYGAVGPIPAESTFWYPLLMENGNYYGRKLLKAAFAPWYFSTLIHLFANRYYERFGEPTAIGRAPLDQTYPDPSDDTKEISGKEIMELILGHLRNRSAVTLSSDRMPVGQNGRSEFEWDIQYLESQMRGADFERYLSRLDEEMSLALFTPLLLMRNADVGSHNLGVQHTQTYLLMLNALMNDLKYYIDRYPLSRLVDYNFSEKAPRCTIVPHAMGKQNVDILRSIITAMVTAGSVKPNIDELGQALGMSLIEIQQIQQPPAIDPATGQPVNQPSGSNPDQRVRVRPGSNGPRGVGEARATGRQISNRVRSQVEKAWRDGKFNDLSLSFGYRKRFMQSLMAEGVPADAAESATNEFYTKLDATSKELVGLGQSEFSSDGDFMLFFDRIIDNNIDDLNLRVA